MELVPGYRLRPALDGDAEAVAAIVNAESEAVLGTPIVTPTVFLELWSRPSVDRSRDVAVVETEAGELCGYLYLHAEQPHAAVAVVQGSA